MLGLEDDLLDIEEENNGRKFSMSMIQECDLYETDSENIFDGIISTSEDEADFDEAIININNADIE